MTFGIKNTKMTNIHTVEVTTKNTGSLAMGISAIAVGVLALLVGWVPFLGLLAIPAAVIGLLLAGIGVILALIKKGKGFGLPVLGVVICAGALILPILSTGGASVAVSQSLEENAKKPTASSSPTVKGTSEGATQKSESSAKAEKDSYIDTKISMYDIEVKYRDSMFDGKVPGVTFKLKNLGDRSLDNIEVTVYFKDKSGAIISEEDYNPVLVSSYSMGDNKPLKPGYVWQMEAGKFYAAKKVPAEWAEGAYEAKITNIKFSEK